MPKMESEPRHVSEIDWPKAQELGSPVEDLYALWLKIGGTAIHDEPEMQNEAALHVISDVLDDAYALYETLEPQTEGFMTDEEIEEVFGS